MSENCVYNNTFIEDAYGLDIVFERDQLKRAWAAIAKEHKTSEYKIKHTYEYAKTVISTAKNYPLNDARVEWFYKYSDAINRREYDRIEFEVLDACKFNRIHGGFGDKIVLDRERFTGHEKEHGKYSYNVSLLNKLVTKRMRQLATMKKEAAKVIIDIVWTKEEEA